MRLLITRSTLFLCWIFLTEGFSFVFKSSSPHVRSNTLRSCNPMWRNHRNGQERLHELNLEPTEGEQQPTAATDSKKDALAVANEKIYNIPSEQQQQQNNPPKTLTMEQQMSMIGTSPRRIFLSVLSATGIALAGNLFGCTSTLLNLAPEELVEKSKLDLYYPRGDFKRFEGSEYGYTFLYPTLWVADTALELAKVQSRVRKLDYAMESRTLANREDGVAEKRRSAPSNIIPDSAFGPPGNLNKRGVSEQGDTNVSVIATPVRKGFTLENTLGDPKSAAETLLKVSLAPEGSGRTATLLDACQVDRSSGESSQSFLYRFEYVVDRGSRGVPLRAISIIAEQNRDTLITFTVVAPSSDWEDSAEYAKFQNVASSFKLIKR